VSTTAVPRKAGKKNRSQPQAQKACSRVQTVHTMESGGHASYSLIALTTGHLQAEQQGGCCWQRRGLGSAAAARSAVARRGRRGEPSILKADARQICALAQARIKHFQVFKASRPFCFNHLWDVQEGKEQVASNEKIINKPNIYKIMIRLQLDQPKTTYCTWSMYMKDVCCLLLAAPYMCLSKGTTSSSTSGRLRTYSCKP